MRTASMLYYGGAVGMALTLGLFAQGPMADALRQDPASSFGLAILFGFAGVAGIFLLFFGNAAALSSRTAF